MKKCPQCNASNENTSKYCKNCGKKLPAKPKVSKKPQKKKLSKKARIGIIAVGSFFGLVIIAFAGLFLYVRYYLINQYTYSYNQSGEIELVSNDEVPEFSASELTVTDSIDQVTFAPMGSKNEFETGFREIYATVNVEGVKGADNLAFKWINEDTGEEIFDYTYEWNIEDAYYSGNIYFPVRIPETEDPDNYKLFGLPGKYRVEFFHNGNLVDSKPFEVKAPEASFQEQVIFDTFNANTAEPLYTKEEFGPESDQLLSGVRMSGRAGREDSFQFVLKDASGQVLKENQARIQDITDQDYLDDLYLYFYISGPHSDRELELMPGNYVVEFYHNNTLERKTPFEVTSPTLGFGNLIIAKEVDSEYAPVEPSYQYILGAKKICATIYVKAATEGDKWKIIWRNREGIIREFEDYYYPDDGEYFNGYKSISLYIPEGQSIEGIDIFGYPGKYLVEFYHNGQLMDSQDFEVVETDVEFGDLIICRDVNSKDDSPINPTSEFSYGIEQVFATIDISGAALDDTCRFTWVNKDTGETVRDFTFKYGDNWNKGGNIYDGYFAMGLVLDDGADLEEHDLLGVLGNYQVNFYHNGYLVGSDSFKIRE
jgi:hypothetical protein